MDHVIRRVVAGGRQGIQERLEDLEFSEGIFLLLQRYLDMRKKVHDLRQEAGQVSLRINVWKTKDLGINNISDQEIDITRGNYKKNWRIRYLGSISIAVEETSMEFNPAK